MKAKARERRALGQSVALVRGLAVVDRVAMRCALPGGLTKATVLVPGY